jgi:hypothetical protein
MVEPPARRDLALVTQGPSPSRRRGGLRRRKPYKFGHIKINDRRVRFSYRVALKVISIEVAREALF